ncbi:MAG: response regulator receiver protein [Bacteroidota bacterium]|nr:response regulator receiver protein [Bacteroidota bacterium]
MNSHLQIIVVDDDHDDKQLFQFALKEAGGENPTEFFDDGMQLLQFLDSSGVNNIGIILLDLNTPVMDGRETLKRLKDNHDWKKIPVIIFSTSDSPEDIRLSYISGAAAYIIKPLGFSKLVEIARAIKIFWFESAILPNR